MRRLGYSAVVLFLAVILGLAALVAGGPSGCFYDTSKFLKDIHSSEDSGFDAGADVSETDTGNEPAPDGGLDGGMDAAGD